MRYRLSWRIAPRNQVSIEPIWDTPFGRDLRFCQASLTEVVEGDAGEKALTVARVARNKKTVLDTIMVDINCTVVDGVGRSVFFEDDVLYCVVMVSMSDG